MNIDTNFIENIHLLPRYETIRFELKRIEKISNSIEENKKDLLYGIVAFANRFGGHIIFGVDNESGKPEGSISKIEQEKYIERIEGWIKYSISPHIDYGIKVLSDSEGCKWTVIVLTIEKSKFMPCAYVKRKGSEIEKRVYYLRNEFGKRLVDDVTLFNLFKNNLQDKLYFPFVFPLIVKNSGEFVTEGFPSFIQEFKGGFVKEYARENALSFSLIFNLMPFIFLKSMSNLFNENNGWYFEFNSDIFLNSILSKSSERDIKTTLIDSSILYEYADSMRFNIFGVNFEELLNKKLRFSISMPFGSKVRIEFDDKARCSILIIENESNFRIKILFQQISLATGSFPKHVASALNDTDSYVYYSCELNAEFFIDGNDSDQMYNEHLHYVNTLINFIKNVWDYREYYKNVFSNEILLTMNKKLRDK